jgi:hypothetical protein
MLHHTTDARISASGVTRQEFNFLLIMGGAGTRLSFMTWRHMAAHECKYLVESGAPAHVHCSPNRCFNFFSPQKFTFLPRSIFYPLFLNEDSKIRKIRLGKDKQVCLRQFSLNINACKVMLVFLKFSGQILKKIIITLNCFDQTFYL